MRARRILTLLLLAFVLLSLAPVPGAQAQSKDLYWERFDVFLTILPNGDLRVVERQAIAFTSGTFTYGYAEIPLDKTEGIFDISVSEPGGQAYVRDISSTKPYSFRAEQYGDVMSIRWYFPPTSNAVRTFDLAYTVRGAVRIYDSGDKLQWIAIDNERDFPILESTVTVSLPQGANFLDIDSAGVPAEWQQSEDKRTVTYVATETLSPSDTFEIGVEFTHGIIPATPPSWQAEFDRQEYFDRKVRPWLILLAIVGTLVILGGGTLLIYLVWYTRGRDPDVGPVPEYVSEPPDDLPAGVLGALIDEKVDMRDVVASILDMARRGYLIIEEVERPSLIGSAKDFVFRRTDKAWDDLRPYERAIMRAIFPRDNKHERKLSALRNKFYRHLPKIKDKLYDELVKRDFFKQRPDKVRARWKWLGIVVIAPGVIGLWFLGPLLSDITPALLCFPGALIVAGASLLIVGRAMPAKTRKGAEAAAYWRAFKAYLQRIDKLADLKQAGELFDRYLPYAVAFGMNRSWIHKFARMEDVPAPGWYVPYGGFVGGHPGGRGVLASPARSLAGGAQGAGLQGMSDGMASSLQSMSDGLTTLLNSTGQILGSAPSSSGSSGGGGFSGGGFSGGGGGGGGGRGFG